MTIQLIRRTGSILNYLAAALTLTFGIMYLLRSSFMPYHSQAISMTWQQIEPNTRILFLALMRAISGGYIAYAFAVFFLQYKFAREKTSWAPLLILILGMISGLTSLYATLLVRLNTPGDAPYWAPFAGMLLIILGYLFNRKSMKK